MGLGIYRFLLAVFVAYSHFPGNTLAPNLAVSSVVGFYFLSGYLMRVSYERFAQHPNPIRSFYLDRLIRIYPGFILVFLVTLGLVWIGYIHVPSIQARSPLDLFLELLVVPQNYGLVTPLLSLSVVPIAWSLGVELQWYLLVPFVFLLPMRVRWALTLALLVGQVLVFAPTITRIGGTVCDYISADWLSCNTVSDMLGYRLLIFVGAVFMLGDLIATCRTHPEQQKWLLAAVGSVYAFFYFVYGPDSGDILTQQATEVGLAMFLFVPLAYAALQRPSSRRSAPLDWVLGKLAYPMFLSHFLARWIVDAHIGNFTFEPIRSNILEYFVVTLAIAGCLAAAQEGVDRLRYRMRGFDSLRRGEHSQDVAFGVEARPDTRA